MDSYYEVHVVVNGAFESSDAFDTRDEADAFAGMTDAALRVEVGEGVHEWEIYILPHVHSRDVDVEACVCRQYDSSHLPDYSSEEED